MKDIFFKSIIDSWQNVPSSFCVGMLLFSLVGAVLLLAFLGFKKGTQWLTGLLLCEYLFLMISLTVLFRPVKIERMIDLTPFWSYRFMQERVHKFLLAQMIMNVVAFIPIGLLLGVSFPNMKWWKVLLIGVAFSILIETLQFFLKRGFAEFDDVFHNVLGCMIGYGLSAAIKYIVRAIAKKRTITPNQKIEII